MDTSVETAAKSLPKGWALNIRFEGGFPDDSFVEVIRTDTPDVLARYRLGGESAEKRVADAVGWALMKQKEIELNAAARSKEVKTRTVELLQLLTGSEFKFNPDAMEESLILDLAWRILKRYHEKTERENAG